MVGQRERLQRQVLYGQTRSKESNKPLKHIPPGSSLSDIILYHYTIGIYLGGIFQTQSLYPIPDPGSAPGERPVVWLSSRDDMEPTAMKAVRQAGGDYIDSDHCNPEHVRMMKGVYRFRLKLGIPVHTIYGYRVHSRAKRVIIDSLVREGMRRGSVPDLDWRVSFVELPLSMVDEVEQWDGDQWLSELSPTSGYRFENGILIEL